MPGRGRPVDPSWVAIGLVVGIIPGVYFHQIALCLTLGLLLGGTIGAIREDKRRGHRRPADPLWFCIGLLVGVAVGAGLHFLGLAWLPGLGLGFALGLFLGAVAGTIRADRRRERERENLDLAKRYRD